MHRQFSIFLLALIILSCGSKSVPFEPADKVNDYLPLQTGKFIVYRLDSTVFTRNGTRIETHSYQVKHMVESETEDNLGRKTFLVHRFIRDTSGTGPWHDNGNYFITPRENSIEVIENNLRSVVLTNPFRENAQWKGNSHMPESPYQSLYDMEVGGDINTWDFVYKQHGDETINQQRYSDVWTIQQSNIVENIPPSPPDTYGSKQVSVEKYARGIGMVYKDFQLYEHQPPHADNPQASYTGFGITLWMIEHN